MALVYGKDPTLSRDFIYQQQVIAKFTDVESRIRYILENIHGARNLDDFDFLCLYWKLALGFGTGDLFTEEMRDEIKKSAIPETIRRCHQKICHPELTTALEFIEAMYKAGKYSQGWYYGQTLLKKFLKTCKYIPTDWKLLRKKGIKEDAIKEFVIS